MIVKMDAWTAFQFVFDDFPRRIIDLEGECEDCILIHRLQLLRYTVKPAQRTPLTTTASVLTMIMQIELCFMNEIYGFYG